MIEESRDCAVHAKACCATPRGVAQGALRPERSPGIASCVPPYLRRASRLVLPHPTRYSSSRKRCFSGSSPIP